MKGSDNAFPSILIEDHVDPAAPADGYHRLFIDTDEKLKMIDHASLVTDFTPGAGGSVATDAIWDAAGDLAVGSGADTAAKLTIGAAGTVPTAGASTLAYAFPPGYELSYVQNTGHTAVTATTDAGADTVVTAAAITFDGSTVCLVEFFAPYATAGSAYLIYCLYDGATNLGRIAFVKTANLWHPIYAAHRVTPSNASHTFSVRAFVDGGTGGSNGGGGGAGNSLPSFIRVTKV
jgi:hypothetical protein